MFVFTVGELYDITINDIGTPVFKIFYEETNTIEEVNIVEKNSEKAIVAVRGEKLENTLEIHEAGMSQKPRTKGLSFYAEQWRYKTSNGSGFISGAGLLGLYCIKYGFHWYPKTNYKGTMTKQIAYKIRQYY